MRPIARPAFAVALACLLGGCLPSGPATHFYVLAPAVEEPAATTRAVPAAVAASRLIVVTDVRLPRYLDRPQIVTRDTGNRLEWAETRQWGGHLGEDMLRVLAMNLGRLLAGDRVVAAPYSAAKAPDYRVEVEVRSFERQHEGRVELAAQWRVTRGSDGTLVANSEETFFGEAVPANASYDSLVNSMSRVYGDLAKAVARSIQPPPARDL